MPDTQNDLATRFVDLALRFRRVDGIHEMNKEDTRVLFGVVVAAGFEPKQVVRGKLVGHYREQDGSTTGETFPINSLCQFKVVAEDEYDHYFATGWLDCAFRRVVYGNTRDGESREELIGTLSEEIARSVPLTPIQLTPEGDLLREYPPGARGFALEYFVDHTRDADTLGHCVGVHAFCNGLMDRNRATKTHDAIVCRKCHLRVLFPKEVTTYGGLRRVLAERMAKVSA